MKPIQFVHTFSTPGGVKTEVALSVSEGVTIALTLAAFGVLLWGVAQVIKACRPR